MVDSAEQVAADCPLTWRQWLGWTLFEPDAWAAYFAQSDQLRQQTLRRQLALLNVLLLYGPALLYLVYFSWQPALVSRVAALTQDSMRAPLVWALRQSSPGALVVVLLILLLCALGTYGYCVTGPHPLGVSIAGYFLVAGVVAYSFSALLGAVLDQGVATAMLLGLAFGVPVTIALGVQSPILPRNPWPALGLMIGLMTAQPGVSTLSSVPGERFVSYTWVFQVTIMAVLLARLLVHRWGQRGTRAPIPPVRRTHSGMPGR
ncbi:MAG TPA: hypothetical protein VM536_06425 [Chloroflexia bacterium]|nr:hypothetical protein [Chloroflexia bacterium]